MLTESFSRVPHFSGIRTGRNNNRTSVGNVTGQLDVNIRFLNEKFNTLRIALAFYDK